MAVDMYLRVNGINGESQDSNHKGWSDISSFSWGASQTGSMSIGGGAGAGKVAFSDLTVMAPMDKSTSVLMAKCASGKHFDKVELSVCKAGGEQAEYCLITLEEVLITGVYFRGAEAHGGILMQYSFQAARVKQQYREQTATGGKGPEVMAGWDIKANKEI